MDSTKLVVSKKTFCLITGGTRGIGKEIAVQFAKKFQHGSTLLLLARNQQSLDATKQEIQKLNTKIQVIVHSFDLYTATKESLLKIINDAIPNPTEYENAVLVQNAGNMGNMSVHAAKMDNIDEWKKFFTLELFVPVLLTTVFIAKFSESKTKLYIVNITSLLGHIPMELNAQFGAGKAARDFYYKVMAVEEPHIKILEYCPGPVETDLLDEFFTLRKIKEEDRPAFRANCLKVDVTIAKMMKILENGEYKSGQFIDYFDDEKGGHPKELSLSK